MTICYCSVLEDCWRLRARGYNDDPEPVPVRACLRPEVPFED